MALEEVEVRFTVEDDTKVEAGCTEEVPLNGCGVSLDLSFAGRPIC